MKIIILLIISLAWVQLSAQISGNITDSKGEPLPYVNIYLQDSYVGTTSNEEGGYNLGLTEISPERGGNTEITIVFQFLGFKTLKKNISTHNFPLDLDITLLETTVSLDEVIISSKEDPAYRIIRETIAQRKENLLRIATYTADFYSRGIWRVKDMPEKILGQKIGDFNGALDSTRTGVIYLSETMSEIAYQVPDNFKENIIASKVSGNDNGFSFNSAQEANFSFYNNTIDLNAAIVSPISANALSYYKYELDGVFYEGSKLINKIKVIPRRPKDRVWKGIIYIAEDDWQIYGVELTTTGEAIQVPMVTELLFKQNFKFDESNNFWIKLSQTIDFGFDFFKVKGDGRFIAVYSNYDFDPQFVKNSFTNEVLSFEVKANKKDSLFWKEIRPIPLTNEELNDYIRKDSIQELRKSKSYLDSLDVESNTIGLFSFLTNYTYKNTYSKWRINYDGPLPAINFNTVQGWNGKIGVSYFKWYDENRTKWLSINTQLTYGESEERLRFSGNISKRFNRTNRLTLSIAGGSRVTQFNTNQPISPLINTFSSLFFERNYMKVFELNYALLSYRQEIFNGLSLFSNISYEKRRPLSNTTGYVTLPNNNVSYTSNNPLNPLDFNTAAIIDHNIIKTQITINITLDQKYMTYPDGKFNLNSDKYPKLSITFENGIGASNRDFNYSQLRARISQDVKLGNRGIFSFNLKGGTFFNGDTISFVDYQHFNGNQTRIGTSATYNNVFNLLPYYSYSTNKNYFEGHLEHDFKGWILGKIPGINQLNFNLVAGAHFLVTESNEPYSELSLGIDNLGIGKFRFIRVDYVYSFFNGTNESAFIFGLKFLDFLN